MILPREKINPLRYSVGTVVFLTLCLLFAEHQSAVQMHGNIDLDYIVSKQGGRIWRQIAYLAFGGFGLVSAYYALSAQHVRLRWNAAFTTLVFVLLGFTTASLLWTPIPDITSKRLFVLGLMFVGAFGLAVSWSHTQILKFLALSAAIQIMVGLVAEVIYGYFTPWASDYRFAGTLPWNSQGYVCLVCTLSALCVARLKLPYRWLYQAIAAYGFVFLLLTRSRGGLLAFLLTMLLYLLLTLDAWQKLASVLAISIMTLFLVMSGVGTTLLSVVNRGGEGAEDFTGRAPLWQELMSYVDQKPLAGYGYEGFWRVDTIDDISGDQLWAIDNAHSGYIEGLLELGWIGLSLHTLTLLFGFVEGIRLFKRTTDYIYFLCASFCFVYLVGGALEALFIVKTSQSSFYFAILLWLLVCQPTTAPLPSIDDPTVIPPSDVVPGDMHFA